jgi:putative transposase
MIDDVVMMQACEQSELDRRMAVLSPHLYDGVALRAAEDAGVPLRTARRWLAAYRADGAAGLMRSPRSDRHSRRIPDELVQVIEGLALRKPPP